MAKEGGIPSLGTETWHLTEAIAGPLIRMAKFGRRRSFRKGEFLYHQGEVDSSFYFILKGRVKVSILREDGAEFVLEVMGRWAICREAAAFDGRPSLASGVALEPVEVIVFDFGLMEEAFRAHPELATALLRITAMKQHVLGLRIQSLASPRPEKRIIELLERLADLYGATDESGTLIHMALTHEQIAAMTGASRVTVTRTLKRLTAEGIISKRGKQIKIMDRMRLKT